MQLKSIDGFDPTRFRALVTIHNTIMRHDPPDTRPQPFFTPILSKYQTVVHITLEIGDRFFQSFDSDSIPKGLTQLTPKKGSRSSAVGIATGYGLDDRGIGVRVPVGSRIFSSRSCPDRLWGPPNLLFNGYRVLFPRG
jgi:hypothetical protein